MWWIALVVIGAALVLLFGIVIIRALAFKPRSQEIAVPTNAEFDDKKLVEDMIGLVKCKTISYVDKSLEDEAEYDKLIARTKEYFPNVYATCEFMRPNKRLLMFKWKGANEGEASVLMAHFDVVPVDEQAWEQPPFEGVVQDGVMWGRGTLDTKATFCGILEATNTLIGQGYVPGKDVYLCFGGDEETRGVGISTAVRYFEDNGIKIGFVLDEGGAVVQNVFPGVKKPCALVGTAEKGVMDLHFDIECGGGHASTPPVHTIVGKLAKAINAVESTPPKMRLTEAAKGMFDKLGRHSVFALKIVFANMWLFKPLLGLICARMGGELNALVRTTFAFTMMDAGTVANVIPSRASVTANVRIINGESIASTIAHVNKVIKNKDIKVYATDAQEPSTISDTDCIGYKTLTTAINECWQDAIISPYLMLACSDSRHFSRISDKVYRFSAMALSKEERGLIHGNNERIPIETLNKVMKFYMRLIRKL